MNVAVSLSSVTAAVVPMPAARWRDHHRPRRGERVGRRRRPARTRQRT